MLKTHELNLLKKVNSDISGCTQCDLHFTKREYVPGIVGDRFPRTVFVGEAPGRHEDLYGEPFCGPSGKLLTRVIEGISGITRGEYTILNIIKCRPPDNRDPKPVEKAACKSYLIKQLYALSPCTIITLGKHAGNFFSRENWPMKKLIGIYFVDELRNSTVVPCYHPSYILRNRSQLRVFSETLKEVFNGQYRGTRDPIGRNFFSTE